MAQYANEYEGVGSALMNIGSLYYSQSEKRKEEERRRKELEDERKYQAAQSEAEWQRKAPAEKIKAALDELRLAEAERSKYTVAGNQLIEQRMVRNADGKLEQVEGRETLSPLNPYNQRPAAAPRPVSMDGPQGPGMYIPDGAGGYTKIGSPIPKTASTSGMTPGQYASTMDRIDSDEMRIKAMSKFDLSKSGTTKDELLKGIEARRKRAESLYNPPKEKAATPKPPMSSGMSDADEAALVSGMAAGSVDPNVGTAILAGKNGGNVKVNIVPQQEDAPEVKAPPAAAIAALRANHDLAEQFDAKFGKGSAAKYLKGK